MRRLQSDRKHSNFESAAGVLISLPSMAQHGAAHRNRNRAEPPDGAKRMGLLYDALLEPMPRQRTWISRVIFTPFGRKLSRNVQIHRLLVARSRLAGKVFEQSVHRSGEPRKTAITRLPCNRK
jgi:hypothetical protein